MAFSASFKYICYGCKKTNVHDIYSSLSAQTLDVRLSRQILPFGWGVVQFHVLSSFHNGLQYSLGYKLSSHHGSHAVCFLNFLLTMDHSTVCFPSFLFTMDHNTVCFSTFLLTFGHSTVCFPTFFLTTGRSTVCFSYFSSHNGSQYSLRLKLASQSGLQYCLLFFLAIIIVITMHLST